MIKKILLILLTIWSICSCSKEDTNSSPYVSLKINGEQRVYAGQEINAYVNHFGHQTFIIRCIKMNEEHGFIDKVEINIYFKSNDPEDYIGQNIPVLNENTTPGSNEVYAVVKVETSQNHEVIPNKLANGANFHLVMTELVDGKLSVDFSGEMFEENLNEAFELTNGKVNKVGLAFYDDVL